MSGPRSLQVFYTRYGTNEHVPSDRTVEMNEADIYSELLGGLEQDGDFFGLVDSDGSTLQVLYERNDDRYLVEIPAPQEGGSFGCRLSFDQVTDLFKALPPKFTATSIPGLHFESWTNES